MTGDQAMTRPSVLLARLWQEFRDVGGIHTELLGIDASPGPARLQVLVIPGNPGSAALYSPLLAHLHAQLGGHAHILAASHAGHDGFSQHGGQVWDLAEQVAHKAALLRQVALLPGRPPLVVVAHSIGAAMMLRAIAEVEGWALEAGGSVQQEANLQPAAAEVDSCSSGGTGPSATRTGAATGAAPALVKLVAVFPFLEAAPAGSSPRQAAIRRLASWQSCLGWVGAAVAALPRALLARCLRMGSGMAAGAAEAIAARLNRSTLRNALYLATDEFKELSRPWPWPQLASGLGQRLHVMGCDEDTWLSREQYAELQQRVQGLQATWHAELRHDFCVFEAQSKAVAEHVAGIAHGDMAEVPSGGGAGRGQRAPTAAAAEAGDAAVGYDGIVLSGV